MNGINRRWVLASRPVGEPVLENFPPRPAADTGAAGRATAAANPLPLHRPYMRGRMSEAKSYAPPVALGEVMVSGTVSRVIASQHPIRD